MRKTLMTALTLGVTTLPAAAQSSGSLMLYGLVDTAIRYTTHENTAGGSSLRMTEGALTGTRWGLRGTEDLGGGTQAMFILESGFSPDGGASTQGGRLFGRTALAGLEGNLGKLYFGRQYTVAHEVLSSYESMGFANVSIVGYQGGNYTGLRQDNMLKYTQALGGLRVTGAWTFGEQTGSVSQGSTGAGSIVYAAGPAEVGVVYQVSRDVSSAFFNAVPAAQASKQTVWGLGGRWNGSAGTIGYLGYTNSRLDVADYRNQVAYVGAKIPLSGALSLIGTLQYDWMRHAGAGGKRLTTAGMIGYAFSKRTDVYAEVDYTHLQGAWIALNGTPAFNSSGNTYGYGARIGTMVGMRHKF